MVKEYVENIMRNGIVNFAEQAEKTTDDVQLLLGWSETKETPIYKKMVKGFGSEEVTFNQILNVRFDLMNREGICAAFITKTLQKYSQELSCSMSELFVIISCETVVEDGIELDGVKLYLYKGSTFIKEIILEEILG